MQSIDYFDNECSSHHRRGMVMYNVVLTAARCHPTTQGRDDVKNLIRNHPIADASSHNLFIIPNRLDLEIPSYELARVDILRVQTLHQCMFKLKPPNSRPVRVEILRLQTLHQFQHSSLEAYVVNSSTPVKLQNRPPSRDERSVFLLMTALRPRRLWTSRRYVCTRDTPRFHKFPIEVNLDATSGGGSEVGRVDLAPGCAGVDPDDGRTDRRVPNLFVRGTPQAAGRGLCRRIEDGGGSWLSTSNRKICGCVLLNG
ncbi:hypothetical protein EVAR_35825_1 [Eumeta japonica]|uniref:Uncharacterized protein n=1 Tax=Eumeta variegata TaxID=151549 RepID=A0A4C1WW66_EUMVA|nr:hypothetical protein EVAR_35825_1 [Eumeta japonica]